MEMERRDYVNSIIQMLAMCSNKKVRMIYHFALYLCK